MNNINNVENSELISFCLFCSTRLSDYSDHKKCVSCKKEFFLIEQENSYNPWTGNKASLLSVLMIGILFFSSGKSLFNYLENYFGFGFSLLSVFIIPIILFAIFYLIFSLLFKITGIEKRHVKANPVRQLILVKE